VTATLVGLSGLYTLLIGPPLGTFVLGAFWLAATMTVLLLAAAPQRRRATRE
jgi:hypothetical protein